MVFPWKPPFSYGFNPSVVSIAEARVDLEASIAPTSSSGPHVSLAADASARWWTTVVFTEGVTKEVRKEWM